MFPREVPFYLKAQKNGLVLGLSDEEAGSKVVVTPKEDDESQLWTFENGYLINKKTALVIDIEGGDLRCDKEVIQYDRKKTMAHNQRWQIRDGFIYAVADPRLVLNSKDEEGARCFVTYRNMEDSELQQWYIEPYDG